MKRLMNMAGLLLVVLLAVVVVATALATMREIKETTENIPVVALPEKPPSSQTITWETYTDPVLGFSLKYPKGWFVRELPSGEVRVGSYDPGKLVGYPVPEDWYGFSLVLLLDTKPSSQLLEEWAVARISEDTEEGETIIVSSELITVAKTSGLKLVLRKGDWEATSVYIQKDNSIYRLSAGPNTSMYHNLLGEILQSLDLE